jgi:hypothetical protein
MDTLLLVGQGLAITLLARLVYQLGHLTGTVDSVLDRLSNLEAWRDARRRPQL